MSEQLSLPLAGRLLEYRFVRRRRRTLAITVDASGVTVSAPHRAPWREIEAFLRAKESWIVAKLEHWAGVPAPSMLRGAHGERLPLFGHAVTLDIAKGRKAVRHDGDRLSVRVQRPERGDSVLRAVIAWLKTRALCVFVPRTAHYATQLGLPTPRVALSSARSQWGVCLAGGSIRLNWRLVHVAPALADYVVAHEVAHLVELNHSKRFWRVLERLYPEWRAARAQLELAGASLPIIRSS